MPTQTSRPEHRYILRMRVDGTSYQRVVQTALDWASRQESRYVCVATVNNVMESFDSPHILGVMNGADIVTPDGMPLVWSLRAMGIADASRVYGPDLTPALLAAAEQAQVPVGFYGGSEATLVQLRAVIAQRYPKIRVAYAYSPPFRPLTPEEDEAVVREISQSGTRLLFIGLNSPKQDLWMAEHRGRVPAVMLGVGAAFDFLAGSKRQAPRWMMGMGLEWLFRLCTEPRRLWRRYLRHNPRFVALIALQLLGGRFGGRQAQHGPVLESRSRGAAQP